MRNNKIYLDTNIVADMIDASREGHEKSLVLLKVLIDKNYHISISEDMLTTLYYISKDKMATLLFFKNIIFIDWEVLSFGLETLKKSTNQSLSNKLDLEDTLQCLCAKEHGCAYVITNDKKFCDCGLEICSVDAFLDKKDKE